MKLFYFVPGILENHVLYDYNPDNPKQIYGFSAE